MSEAARQKTVTEAGPAEIARTFTPRAYAAAWSGCLFAHNAYLLGMVAPLMEVEGRQFIPAAFHRWGRHISRRLVGIASLAEATAGQPEQGHLLSQISTRLFFSRPSAVSFDATGS